LFLAPSPTNLQSCEGITQALEDGLLWHTEYVSEQEEISKVIMNPEIEFIRDTCNQYSPLQMAKFQSQMHNENAENNVVLRFMYTHNYLRTQNSEIKYYYGQFQKLFGNDQKNCQKLYQNIRNSYKKIINNKKEQLWICDAIELEILQKMKEANIKKRLKKDITGGLDFRNTKARDRLQRKLVC